MSQAKFIPKIPETKRVSVRLENDTAQNLELYRDFLKEKTEKKFTLDSLIETLCQYLDKDKDFMKWKRQKKAS
jgi:hypothetical protein